MKVHPNGTLEGSPEEIAQYQKMMQGLTKVTVVGIRPEASGTVPAVMPPSSWFSSGGTQLKVGDFPPLWNGGHPAAAAHVPYLAWVNIRDQAEGCWAMVTGDKFTPL